MIYLLMDRNDRKMKETVWKFGTFGFCILFCWWRKYRLDRSSGTVTLVFIGTRQMTSYPSDTVFFGTRQMTSYPPDTVFEVDQRVGGVKSGAYPEGGTWVNVPPPPSGFLKILISHQELWLLMVNHGKLSNEQYSIPRIFSLRSFPVISSN